MSIKKENQHIEIAQLAFSSDAHILRGLLETADIKVFLFNEGFSSLTPADAVASGGIKIHVPFKEKEKAEKITTEFFKNLEEEKVVKCANCNSTNLKYDYKEHLKHIVINLISLFGGTNASHGFRHYKKCLECGYQY